MVYPWKRWDLPGVVVAHVQRAASGNSEVTQVMCWKSDRYSTIKKHTFYMLQTWEVSAGYHI